MRRAPTAPAAVFAVLVLATLAAFAWSQRLKRDPLVLDRVSFVAVPRLHPEAPPIRAFTPNRDCRYDRIRVRFRVTRSDRAHVQVVKPGGKLIITLARDTYLKRYRFHTYYWDGRQRNDQANGKPRQRNDRANGKPRQPKDQANGKPRGGGRAEPGRYKLRVKLLGQDRTLVPGGVMRLHDAPRDPRGACKRGSK